MFLVYHGHIEITFAMALGSTADEALVIPDLRRIVIPCPCVQDHDSPARIRKRVERPLDLRHALLGIVPAEPYQVSQADQLDRFLRLRRRRHVDTTRGLENLRVLLQEEFREIM